MDLAADLLHRLDVLLRPAGAGARRVLLSSSQGFQTAAIIGPGVRPGKRGDGLLKGARALLGTRLPPDPGRVPRLAADEGPGKQGGGAGGAEVGKQQRARRHLVEALPDDRVGEADGGMGKGEAEN